MTTSRPPDRRSTPDPRSRRASTLALIAGIAGLAALAGAQAACGGPPDEDPRVPADRAGDAPGDTARMETPAVEDSAPHAPLPEWSLDPRVVEAGSRPVATQVEARTGAHEEYDRLVLVFDEAVPGYTVRYPAEPLHQCGSGRPVTMDAPVALELSLEPARAHDEAGNATVRERSLTPRLPVLRSARLTCDFEGHVEWAVGLQRRTPFRVFTLDSPARLVVDFRR